MSKAGKMKFHSWPLANIFNRAIVIIDTSLPTRPFKSTNYGNHSANEGLKLQG
jgi:hypothetical protein